MRVLVVNAGSSSLKLRVLDGADELTAEQDLSADRGELEPDAVCAALARLPAADAVGHRIVHGGDRFRTATVVDAEVESALGELVELAPLHQPGALTALELVSDGLPGVPAVACFDTAFHSTIPAAAATYALPAEWRERWGLRRYGFHGLSHAYVARRTPELLGVAGENLRIVSCHLGSGASLAAISGGVCTDTTMGFTPLEGLVMATRSGSVDPGLLLWLLERKGMEAAELEVKLERESGLLGLAGTADMAEVVREAELGREPARLAFDVYTHRLRAGIAAMAAALGGLDALVFTGGVGEHAPAVRAAAAERLGFLGVELDAARNEAARDDREIAAPETAVRSVVLTAREDLEIARQVREVLTREA